jgi:hypothetical protein
MDMSSTKCADLTRDLTDLVGDVPLLTTVQVSPTVSLRLLRQIVELLATGARTTTTVRSLRLGNPVASTRSRTTTHVPATLTTTGVAVRSTRARSRSEGGSEISRHLDFFSKSVHAYFVLLQKGALFFRSSRQGL